MRHIYKILYKNYQKSTCSFIPFITAGYPNIDLTLKAIDELDKAGADIIELGVPYSDALADGNLIQEASKVAIQNGVNLDKVISLLSIVTNKIKAPIIVFTYYNPILARGINVFVNEIASLNVKGLIIPDLPLEEADYVIHVCEENKVELILFISPTSSKNRIRDIVNKSPGSLYLVSSTGVTGIRDSIDESISSITSEVLQYSHKMIMLGFGISSPSHVEKILRSSISINGVVIGSAITRIFSNYSTSNSSDIIKEIGEFCKKIKYVTIKNS